MDMFRSRIIGNAQVAELVDAQVSGTCVRKDVEVRVFSWAPFLKNRDIGRIIFVIWAVSIFIISV
jgi:hypothetical protein